MDSEIAKQHINKYSKYIRGTILLSLTLLIFVNPFQNHVSALTEIFFYTALAFASLLLLSSATRPDFNSPLGLPFLFFLLWAFASAIWAFDRENTLHDVYRHLLRHLVLYYMLISFFVRKEHFLVLVWSFITSIAIFSLGAVIYVYIISANPLSFRLEVRGVGPNQIAQLCVFGMILSLFYLPMAGKWHEKIVLLICFISTFSAVVLTYCRAALLALAAGCFFLLFTPKFKKSLVFATVFIFTVAIIIFNLSPHQQSRLSFDRISKDLRISIYATDYAMIKDKPFAGFGYGAEAFKKNFFKFNKSLPQRFALQEEFPHPHNIFVDIFIRLGLVGFVLFCWILFRVFKMARELIIGVKDPFVKKWGTCMTACLIAFLTLGLLGNILNSRNAVILYTIMAMITILWKIHRSAKEVD